MVMRRVCIGGCLLAGLTLAACSRAAGPAALPWDGAALPFDALPNAGFTSLYSFKGLPDGAEPAAGMVALGGVLYGTTQVGGQGNAGAVFSTSTTGKEHVLYSFGSHAPDGVFPVAGLVALNGTFYGTASAGGSHGFGAVFKIDKSGHEQLLYSFAGSKDGAAPYASLVVVNGALYGTTTTGGGSANCPQGCGTVFEVTTAGKEHVVYAFKGGKSDGSQPVANLVAVSSVLYGTTPNGGKNGNGTVFKTTTSGSENLLHSFGTGTDGGEPEAGLTNVGGTLYGTTNAGGKNFSGTVYKVSTAGQESVIYNFKGGQDGANPEASLTNLNGTLYGTTAGGGSGGAGTVFSVSTSGQEHVVHALTSSEGSDPRSHLVAIGSALYGTASMGGGSSVGTIFKATP